MTELLHIDCATVRETDSGTSAEVRVVGEGRGLATRLIACVGEEVRLKTPGKGGRELQGVVTALGVKEAKEGKIAVTVKIAGAKGLNDLVGTNVDVTAAQMDLPIAPKPEPKADTAPLGLPDEPAAAGGMEDF